MPVLASTSLLDSLAASTTVASPPLALAAANSTASRDALRVVCAWPVSGQYGPGSRILYYVLVAACVMARKTEWLRNACLAAALLFPAVAAVHAIVLAAMHIDGAVDMDVYGAFQLCAIGILAAPVTVRLSTTYFYDPGRNTIFIWTGLVLAGLLSLTVEFYRLDTVPCQGDVSSDPLAYPYPEGSFCGMRCSISDGPTSRMRTGATDEIFVIPGPPLSFGTAMLLAAGCCIPAVLSMISMWAKILEINWKSRFGPAQDDEEINGTNGATVGKMRGVNAMVRSWLSVVEAPLFGAAVLAILIVGEMNFWSPQMTHQTEEMTSIGQWAPMVGTLFAALGSLYLLLADDTGATRDGPDRNASPGAHHCRCSHHDVDDGTAPRTRGTTRPDSTPSSGDRDAPIRTGEHSEKPREPSVAMAVVQQTESPQWNGTLGAEDLTTTKSEPVPIRPGQRSMSLTSDVGGRRKVARTLTLVSNFLGTAAHDAFDDSEFKRGRAVDFPEIPGEASRNRALSQIREQYNQPRDRDGNITPGLQRQRSRNGSPTGSYVSGLGITDGDPSSPVQPPASPRPSRSSSTTSSPTRSPRRPHSSTFPVQRPSVELQTGSFAPSVASGETPRRRSRRDTLDVPSPVHHSSSRNEGPSSPIAPSIIQMTASGPGPPMIVVSPDPDTTSFDLAPQPSPSLAPVDCDLSPSPPDSPLFEAK